MGRFVLDTSPDLHQRLDWPQDIPPGSVYISGVLPLKERLKELLQVESQTLRQLRRAEADVLSGATQSFEAMNQLARLHRQIVDLGEIPDYQGAERFFQNLAQSLIAEGNFPEVFHLCKVASNIPFFAAEHCRLISQMAQEAITETYPKQR